MSGFATCIKRSLCIPASFFLVTMFIAEGGAQEAEAPLDLSLSADTNNSGHRIGRHCTGRFQIPYRWPQEALAT